MSDKTKTRDVIGQNLSLSDMCTIHFDLDQMGFVTQYWSLLSIGDQGSCLSDPSAFDRRATCLNDQKYNIQPDAQ